MIPRGNHSFLVALASLLLALAYLFVGRRYGLGNFSAPGPGLYPRVLGIVFLAISIWGLWETVRARLPERLEVSASESLRVVATVGTLVGYTLVLHILGSLIATFLLSLVAMLVMRWRGWFKVPASAAAVAIGIEVLFVKLLGVQLPAGILPW